MLLYYLICANIVKLSEVKLLFRNPLIENEFGQNALHLFTARLNCGRTETLKIGNYLMDMGCDPVKIDNAGNTPLFLYIRHQRGDRWEFNNKLFRVFVNNTTLHDMKLKNSEGRTYLLAYIEKCYPYNLALIKLMLKRGVPVNHIDKFGNCVIKIILQRIIRDPKFYRMPKKEICMFLNNGYNC